MVFRWSLSDSKSPKVSGTPLRILSVFNNVIACSPRILLLPLLQSFDNPLVTVPKAAITIGIIVIFMFRNFFSPLARSRYLSFFSLSFSFILRSAGTAKFTILQDLSFFFLLLIVLVVWSSRRDLREVCPRGAQRRSKRKTFHDSR